MSTHLGFRIYMKYGKFWSISPGHFFKHKPTIHCSKFSKRTSSISIRLQKLVTYFGQISPDFAFLIIRGVQTGSTSLNNWWVFGEWRFLVWRGIQIGKKIWTVALQFKYFADNCEKIILSVECTIMVVMSTFFQHSPQLSNFQWQFTFLKHVRFPFNIMAAILTPSPHLVLQAARLGPYYILRTNTYM